MPTCWSQSGRASANGRRSTTRSSTSRARSRNSCTCIPALEELGRVYQADLLINSGMPEFASAARRTDAGSGAWVESTQAARGEYEAWQKPVKVPGSLNMSEVILYLKKRLPRRSYPDQRRRQFHAVGAPLLSLHGLSHAARAHQRRDGLRRAGRRRGEARASRPPGHRVRRRRRLPDERPGARDRRAVRRESYFHAAVQHPSTTTQVQDRRRRDGAVERAHPRVRRPRWTGSSPTTSARSPGRWAASPPTTSTPTS